MNDDYNYMEFIVSNSFQNKDEYRKFKEMLLETLSIQPKLKLSSEHYEMKYVDFTIPTERKCYDVGVRFVFHMRIHDYLRYKLLGSYGIHIRDYMEYGTLYNLYCLELNNGKMVRIELGNYVK